MSALQVSSIENTSGRIILGNKGSIIQTVFSRSDDRINYTSNPAGNGNTITPLGITITPRSIGSRIICQWMINGELHEDNVFLMHRNGVLITTGNPDELGYNRLSGNVRWSGIASAFYDVNQDSTPSNWILMYSQISESLIPRTYCPAVRSSSGGTYTFSLNKCINYTESGQDNVEIMVSTGIAYEIAE
jgi:hypothetical protein